MYTVRRIAIYFASAISVSVLLTQTGFAAPRVEGNTIYLPEDGWYQVQDSDNFQSICNGTLTCDVESGNYIVINHTTGERFESVEVLGEPSPVDGVTVNGNQISWPDNGWYQVQDFTTYETVCEGGSECTVPDGNYIVINHTTGKRVEPVLVPSNGNPALDVISVVGNRISWPDDGWYQVQDARTFESLCNGESSCTVPAGEYIVINHTTGRRYDGIEVGGESPRDSIISDSNYLGILRNVISIINVESLEEDRLQMDDLALDFSFMGADVLAGEVPDAGLSLVLLTQDSPSLTIQDYTCTAGGTLSLPLYDFGFAPVTRREFSFDQCIFNGIEYAGSYSFTRSRRGPDVYTLNNVSAIDEKGDRFVVNGVRDDSTNANPLGIELISWTDTTYITETDSDLTTVNGLNWFREAYETQVPGSDLSGYIQLQDGSVGFVRLVEQHASLDSNFHVVANWSEEQDIRVEANLDFDNNYFDWSSFAPNVDVQVPDYPVSELGTPLTLFTSPDFNPANAIVVDNNSRRSVQWESGQIRLTAFDGSTLLMRPSSEDSLRVEILLNDSAEVLSNTWANGLQVLCPDTFSDECL